MLIGLRTGTWSGKPLPYDAEVEWIRGTQWAWFDLGHPRATLADIANVYVDVTFKRDTIEYDMKFFGYAQSGLYCYPGARFRGATPAVDLTTQKWRAVHERTHAIGQWTLYNLEEGTKYDVRNMWHPGFQNDNRIIMNGVYYGSSVVNPSNLYIYSAKFEADDFTHDLIPVRGTRADGAKRGFLYDKVTGAMFGNARFDDDYKPFVIGPDKSSSNGGV